MHRSTRDDYCEKMFNAGIEILRCQYETFRERRQAGDKHIGFAARDPSAAAGTTRS